METNIFKLKSPTPVQVYTKRSICLLIILALITPALAQNDYYARKAQQYQKKQSIIINEQKIIVKKQNII